MASLNEVSLRALARLRYFKPAATQYDYLPLSRRAAVLVLLYGDRNGDLRVVLTLRSGSLNSYAGQVAFPGGKADNLEETAYQTARREASEEIGLPQDDQKIPAPFRVEPLCEMPVYVAVTELGVRPCVSFLNPDGGDLSPSDTVEGSLMPKLNAIEVAAIFTAPFRAFLSSKDPFVHKDHKTAVWHRGEVRVEDRYTRWAMQNFFVPAQNHTKTGGKLSDERYRVWGMTARMLIDAARLAYGEEPDFPFSKEVGDEDVIRTWLRSGRMSSPRQPGDAFSNQDLDAAANAAATSKL
ncbi:hypothetical protein MMC25_000181 [Agyrium rufum]|nr:hypothetical protein [Agyrium rufum]